MTRQRCKAYVFLVDCLFDLLKKEDTVNSFSFLSLCVRARKWVLNFIHIFGTLCKSSTHSDLDQYRQGLSTFLSLKLTDKPRDHES